MRSLIKRLILGSILLTACSRFLAQPTLTPTPAPSVSTAAPTRPPFTPTAAATATRAAPPVAPTVLPTPSKPVPLNFNAKDNARLAANYYPPIVRPAPGVLLIHMLGGSKADWDSFARELQKQGYAALAIDLRGFGGSAQPEDWTKAPDDVKSAWEVLAARPEVDRNRTAIVGASIGANLALMVGGTDERITAVVALSPGLDYHGLNPSSALAGFAQRPAFLIAARDDSYSADSVEKLAKLSVSAETLILDAAGHGTAMLTREPTLAQELIEWLNKNVRDVLKG